MWQAEDWQPFMEQCLFRALGHPVQVQSYQFLGGGCINTATSLNTDQGAFFLKWNQNEPEGMFSAEARGLQLLREHFPHQVPEPLGWGEVEGTGFLLLDLVEPAPRTKTYWQDLGLGLAELHRHTAPDYGLDHDNYIGRLPQSNRKKDRWTTFFAEERLRPMARMAFDSQWLSPQDMHQLDELMDRLPELMPEEPPSLLHGDLWSGNLMVGDSGQPCLVDPAVHFGHREAELHFTRMFGGFQATFYHAYKEAWPLQGNDRERTELFNLYPLLVHVNLFGAGYVSGVRQVLKRYV